MIIHVGMFTRKRKRHKRRAVVTLEEERRAAASWKGLAQFLMIKDAALLFGVVVGSLLKGGCHAL